MRRALYILLPLLLLPVLAVLGLCVTLNTGGGRHFAETEINRLAAPTLRITGLAGHFPADIRLATVTLAAHYANFISVVAGTTFGMLLANVPAVLVGNKIANRIPLKLVHGLAAGLFVILGLLTLFNVGNLLPQ